MTGYGKIPSRVYTIDLLVIILLRNYSQKALDQQPLSKIKQTFLVSKKLLI